MTDKKYQLTLDTQLWNDFLKGDKKAFNVIYMTNVQLLYKYGLNFSQDKDIVQDCIHDVFVDLHKYRNNLKETNNIRAYLFKALKNSIVKAICRKKKQYQLDHVDIPFFYEESSEESLIEDDTASYRTQMIKKGFSQLSNRQKEALYLKYNSELGYEEISQILNINYQSARNLIHRSIEKLRENYRKEGIFLFLNLLPLIRK